MTILDLTLDDLGYALTMILLMIALFGGPDNG